MRSWLRISRQVLMPMLWAVLAVVVVCVGMLGWAGMFSWLKLSYTNAASVGFGIVLTVAGYVIANVAAVGLCAQRVLPARPIAARLNVLWMVVSVELFARLLSGIQYIDCGDQCVPTLMPRPAALWTDGLVLICLIATAVWWTRRWRKQAQ